MFHALFLAFGATLGILMACFVAPFILFNFGRIMRGIGWFLVGVIIVVLWAYSNVQDNAKSRAVTLTGGGATNNATYTKP